MSEVNKASDPTRADYQSTRGSVDAVGGTTGEPERAEDKKQRRVNKWSFGVLNDKFTDEVPGTRFFHRNLLFYVT